MVTIEQIIKANGSDVICIPPQDINYLAPCDHEEADTRMILHWQMQSTKVSRKFQYAQWILI